jgi:hypothetical protein
MLHFKRRYIDAVKWLTRFLSLGLIFQVSVAQAQVLDLLSKGTYHLFNGPCEPIDKDPTTEALDAACNCQAQKASNIKDLKAVAEPPLEKRFIDLLAQRHAENLKCAADFAQQVSDDNSVASKHIAQRISLLRDAKRQLVKATQDLMAPGPHAKICPTDIQSLLAEKSPDGKYTELCTVVIQSRAAVNTLQASIPLIGEPGLAKFVDLYANSREPEDEDQLKKQIAQAYAKARTALLMGAEKIRGPLTRADKRALFSDPKAINAILDGPNGKDLKGVACQANAKYGEGADLLDTSATIGSLLLGGAAFGASIKASGAAVKIAQGAMAARSQGLLTITSTRVLMASAGAVASPTALSAVDAACSNNKISTIAKSDDAKSCESAPTIAQIEQDDCILSAALAAMDYAPGESALKVAGIVMPARMLKGKKAVTAPALEKIIESTKRNFSREQAVAIAKRAYSGPTLTGGPRTPMAGLLGGDYLSEMIIRELKDDQLADLTEQQLIKAIYKKEKEIEIRYDLRQRSMQNAPGFWDEDIVYSVPAVSTEIMLFARKLVEKEKMTSEELLQMDKHYVKGSLLRQQALKEGSQSEGMVGAAKQFHGVFEMDLSSCKDCPRYLMLRDNRESHVLNHVLNTPDDEDKKIYSMIATSAASAQKAEQLEHLLDRVRPIARVSRPTTTWTKQRSAEAMTEIGMKRLKPSNHKIQENGNGYFEVETGGNRIAVVYCAKKPCVTKGLSDGDVDTIFPICGNDVIELPSQERVSRLLEAVKANPDQPLNRDLRQGMPRLKPCKP